MTEPKKRLATSSEEPKTFNITPSARVLQMLGMIEFKGWQCVAELVDNSIDGYSGSPKAAHKDIEVLLPRHVADLEDETTELRVVDYARGMSPTELNLAVTAGYSGNDPVSKLGLFGMGFNIATARLGKRTEVWTSRAEDSEKVGVRIDFDELQKARRFDAPRLTSSKGSSAEHGTEVRISKLDPERVRKLLIGQGKSSLLSELGRTYGFIRREKGIKISVNGEEIRPWSHCAWGPDRYVQTARFGKVPAVIQIDEDLGEAPYCHVCWNWLDPVKGGHAPTVCPSCDTKGFVKMRPRRVKGWLGVQRFYDQEHYGIDFIRNGRVISRLDKEPFYWVDPDTEKEECEYPLDALHWGGRLIGEIECDFVRATHTKDSFDHSDPNWRRMLRVIRGDSPFRPQHPYAVEHPNKSPLSRLFTGYRKGTPPGLEALVPGDAEGNAINTDPREWANKFWAGEEEYQSDKVWYDAVQLGSRVRRQSKGTTAGESAAPPKGPAPPGQAPVGDPAPPGKTTDTLLSHDYGLPELGESVEIRVYQEPTAALNGAAIRRGKIERRTMEYSYDPAHEFFQEFPDDPIDLVLVELAHHLSLRNPDTIPGQLYCLLKQKFRADTRLDLNSLGEQARGMLTDLTEFLAVSLRDKPAPAPELSAQEMAELRRRVTSELGGGEPKVRELLANGQYVRHMPLWFVDELVGRYPERFLDDHFWQRAYATVEDLHLKAQVLQDTRSFLADVIWLWEKSQQGGGEPYPGWKTRLQRAASSLRLLEVWKVPPKGAARQ